MDTLEVTSPYDGAVVGSVPILSAPEVEVALRHAERLFHDRSQWIPLHRRLEILRRAIELIEEQFEELVQTAILEGGKPRVDTEAEVRRGVEGIRSAIATMYSLGGHEVPMGQSVATSSHWATTVREPIGVVLAITAFNHPFNLIIHQTVTAVAAGCPVLVKPAPSTPLSCQALVGILHEAGLPEAWCQMIVCDNAATAKLAQDPRLAYVSFIGSASVGWQIRSQLAPGVACMLEHGGAAPVIVLEDADIKPMLPLLTKGGYYHAGQVCVSVQRILTHSSCYDAVIDGLTNQVKELKVGDPLDAKTEVGPLIRTTEVDRVESWVQAAGHVQVGGERLSASCYAPTLLANPPHDALVSTQEIFGPVVCVYPFDSRDEAIERANSLPYAFQAAIFGERLDPIIDVSKRLRATAVIVNDQTAFRADWMPFGGRRHSGLGIGGIPYAIRDLMPEKLIVFRSSSV